MNRLSGFFDRLKKTIAGLLSFLCEKLKGKGPLLLPLWYGYGMLINSLQRGIDQTFGSGNEGRSLFEWNPILNLLAVFTPFGLGFTAFLAGMTFLFSKRGYDWLSGEKTVHDPRGFDILSDGVHGTGGWMAETEISKVLETGSAEELTGTILGKLIPTGSAYRAPFAARRDAGLNPGHILIYGSSGTGKSRGVILPFILQGIRRRESLVVVDSKGELYERTSVYAREMGYTVRSYNTLDPDCSDGCNFLSGVEEDPLMIQTIAEVIIKSTSNANERQDFWEKAEKNLLMAMLLYVQTQRDPLTGELLPIYRRSIPEVYRILSTESFQEIDDRFSHLPSNHPALPPYGIFKLANRQIWGNIAVGLGNRLAVFQNPMLNRIASYDDIDLQLPGRQPCIYYCIISDNDSTLEFMSSLFFSLMFSRLINYARRYGENGRLPLRVNMVMDEFCNIYLNDAKRLLSVVRSRNIFCQLATQGVSQLSDRYPHQEWEEIISNCDTQIYLGGNDLMTAKYLSEKCSQVTVRTNSSITPMEPLFSPFASRLGRFSQNKSSAQRPLMLPDEIMRMDDRRSLILLRGHKPLQLEKIRPEELPAYPRLTPQKATEYVPGWRLKEDKMQPHKWDAQGEVGEKREDPVAHNTGQKRSREPPVNASDTKSGGSDNLRPYTGPLRTVSPEDVLQRGNRIQ